MTASGIQIAATATSGDGPNYAKPPAPHYPLEQGFSLRIGGTTRPLDRRGFSDIRFRGQYREHLS